jgi:hypothetical protein
MNKLIHHGIQLQVQLETHEVYLKPKIETYMIWGNIILDLAKHTVIHGPIELEFSGTCHTLWPQGTWLHYLICYQRLALIFNFQILIYKA